MFVSICEATPRAYATLKYRLREHLLQAPIVPVNEWQSRPDAAAYAETAELEDVCLSIDLPPTLGGLTEMFTPNLPWADEHFRERVSGAPLNPPPSHERWPFRQANNNEHRDQGGAFSHSYPERLWAADDRNRRGIRFPYGDLADALHILHTRRATRQVFIPIWFPEDLCASIAGERVPCSIGYHVLVRNNALTIKYVMRSCDFLRHFDDDLYMAARLGAWLAEQLEPGPDKLVVPCTHLTVFLSSLHVFAPADLQLMAYRRARDDASRV